MGDNILLLDLGALLTSLDNPLEFHERTGPPNESLEKLRYVNDTSNTK